MSEWGIPVLTPKESMPVRTSKAGRRSTKPGLVEWFDMLEAPTDGSTEPNMYELPSKDEDNAHPVSRVTQMRGIAKEYARIPIAIETLPVVAGKRYRIWAAVKPANAVKANGTKSKNEAAKEAAKADAAS